MSALIILGLGIYVLTINHRSPIHKSLTVFCLNLSFWLLSFTIMYNAPDAAVAYRWARVGFSAVAFIPFAGFLFILKLLKKRDKNWILLSTCIASAAFAAFGQTDLLYSHVRRFFWGYYPMAGVLYPLFIIYCSCIWVYGLVLLYKHMTQLKMNRDFLLYNQTKYIFFAFCGGAVGAVDAVAKSGLPMYPFSYICALYWAIIASVSITRLRILTDFSFLSRRILIVSVALATIAILAGGAYTLSIHTPLGSLLSNEWGLTIFSVAGGLCIPPIFRTVKERLDEKFFQEYHERKEKLISIEQEILSSRNLDEFNRVVLESLFSAFNITHGAVFIWDEKEKVYMMTAASGWSSDRRMQHLMRLSDKHPIPASLSQLNLIDFNDIRRDVQSISGSYRDLILSMLELDAALCMPIRNGRLLGFLVLGNKESGIPYASEDYRTLHTLTRHIVRVLESLDLLAVWQNKVAEGNLLNRQLQKYLSPTVADEILRRVNHAQTWKGDRRHVSILITDIRGFSSISVNNDPEDVVQWLNEYLTEMVEIAISNGGTVDKFMGDGILVVFGAPVPLENHEYNASKCALEMMEAVRKSNKRRLDRGLVPLEIGIALTAGDVISGNIGSDKRMEYTVIGDPVNLAARLQSLAASNQILTTRRVADKVADKINLNKISPVTIRGKMEKVELYEITGFKGLNAVTEVRAAGIT